MPPIEQQIKIVIDTAGTQKTIDQINKTIKTIDRMKDAKLRNSKSSKDQMRQLQQESGFSFNMAKQQKKYEDSQKGLNKTKKSQSPFKFFQGVSGINKQKENLDKLRDSEAITGEEHAKRMKQLERSNPTMFKAADKLKKYEDKQKGINAKNKAVIASSRGLNRAFLSVMFTGMALTRVFGGMVKGVFDILGVTDMLNATILVVLLPALEPLAEILYNVMDWFMNLPEPIQKVIGGLVIFAAAVGWIMTVVGMLGTFFTGGWAIMGKVVTWFLGLLTPIWTFFSVTIPTALGITFGAFLAIIAVIVLLIIGAIEAWKKNFFGFRDALIGIWEAIKTYFMGFVQFWSGVWDLLVGIFTLNGDKISGGFKKIGEGIKNMFIGVVNFIANILNALIGLIISALAQVVRAAQWVWNKIPGHAPVTWYEDIMASGANKTVIPTFANGGVMPYTGMAMLHAGETITPAGQTLNSSPTINIQASIASDYDVRRLADQLSKYWVNDMERVSKSRGII